jgi:hypothetical protein
MKSFDHHAKRLLARMMQAETVTNPEKAEKIVRKAEKHRQKMSRLRALILKLSPGDKIE